MLRMSLAWFCPSEPEVCDNCEHTAYCQTIDSKEVIPQRLPPNIDEMIIKYHGNKSVALASEMFSRYLNLSVVWIYGHMVTSLKSSVFRELTKLTYLSLHNTQIKLIPDLMLPAKSLITCLELFDNKLTRIPYKLFNDLPHLTKLDLGYNPIILDNCSSIGWQFTLLKHLKGLSLENATVPSDCESSIKVTFFDPVVTTVTELNVTYGNYFSGNSSILQNFYKLQRLDISLVKRYVDCPAEAQELFNNLPASLQQVHFRHWWTDVARKTNCLVTSDTFTGLKNLPNLTRLNMEYGGRMFGLNLYRSVFSGFQFLEILNIGWNGLLSMEKYALDGTPNLSELILDGNLFERQPLQLFQNRNMSNLKQLQMMRTHIMADYSINYKFTNFLLDAPIEAVHLEYNFLNRFPTFTQNQSFAELRTICLDFNSLPELTSGGNLSRQCEYLPNLAKFTASHNILTKLDGLCSTITQLIVSHNQLGSYWESINADAISRLQNLTVLDLSYNLLTSISSNLFHNMYKLSTLRLTGNKFTIIASNTFLSNTFLTLLDLGDNSLTEFTAPTIQHLSNLKTLNLEDNRITSMDPELIKYLNNKNNSVKSVGLIGNPFVCSCDQEFFQKWRSIRRT